MLAWSISFPVRAQSLVTTLTLGPDQIGLVRTAQGITTRITFSEPVIEIVCGDLYDASSGKGSFVVQRSGTSDKPGNDVFIKPIAAKGMSNLFVTTGDAHRRTFNFDLKIVSGDQAHRVVNVIDATPRSSPPDPGPGGGGDPRSSEPEKTKAQPDLDRLKNQAEEQARQKGAEILRNAQQQADRKIAEAEARLTEANARADHETEARFIRAMMLGVREQRIAKPKVVARRATLSLDPRVLTFDDRTYVRYTIQNSGPEDFNFGSIALEVEGDKGAHPLTAEVNQSKPENKLLKDETLSGVIVFDARLLGQRDRVTLYLRAEDGGEIARILVLQPESK